MDYYPQPRPVLYGTTEEESPPPTQTAPVRIGPPRYPPAPPLAGDAPDPFNHRPGRHMSQQSFAEWEGHMPYWWVGIVYVFAVLRLLVTSRSARRHLLHQDEISPNRARYRDPHPYRVVIR